MNKHPRIAINVIQQMLNELPNANLIQELQQAQETFAYKAPEDPEPWEAIGNILHKYIPKPTKDFEYKIISIFMCITVEEVIKKFNPNNTSN